jgi:hypothetical protein
MEPLNHGRVSGRTVTRPAGHSRGLT